MDNLVRSYRPSNDLEAAHKESVLILLQSSPRCYYRDFFDPGHITGSALLVSADGARVLMNHHKTLNKWLCFGGHADGDQDVLRVAAREVTEESGIGNIEPYGSDIFDIDVHPIPANPAKDEPAHQHFDIRYLFRVRDKDSETFTISDESVSLRWCGPEEAVSLVRQNGAMARLLAKWQEKMA